MSRNRVQDAKMEGELLALTYGAIVARVMKDTEQCEEANAQVKYAKVLHTEFRPSLFRIRVEIRSSLSLFVNSILRTFSFNFHH